MAEKMVRTQVYLPRAIYSKLQARAERHGLTLAVQIREALEAYIRLTNGKDAEEPILDPNDPVFELIKNAGRGPEDLAEKHDKYLYSDPHGEESLKQEAIRAAPKPLIRQREKPTHYRAKTRKRQGRRK